MVGGGGEDFREDHLIFRRTKGEIAENFGRIQRGDHSNLFGKLRALGGSQKLLSGITSVK